MTRYLSQATIRAAVDRLGESRGQSSILDFLVFKRAQLIGGGGSDTHVVSGLKSATYVAAIAELAQVADPEKSELSFFSPFGARRDKGRGYKKNGTAARRGDSG